MRESVIYQEILQEGRQQGIQEGRQEGRQQGEATLVLRQLAHRRLGQLTSEVRSQIQQLRVEQLEELGEALLDFSSVQDLMDWLENQEQ